MRGVIVALTLAASLLGALSPAAWARTLGFHPDAWQAAFLASEAPRELLNVTRQGGKSTVMGWTAGHGVVHGRPGFTALIAAPSERQSTELIRKVAGVVHTAIEAGHLPKAALVAEGATHLELAGQRRVLAVPAKEATVRGFTADLLILDEAARIPDALFRAVTPMLAVSGGRLIAASTPWGQRGWFYQEWTHGGPTWTRTQVTWRDCPRMDAAFIADERAAVARQGMDPDAWIAQEYEGSFAAAVQGSYYGRLLEAARREGRIGQVPYDPRLPVHTAWDLGVGDATAIWLYQVVGLAVHVLAYYEQTGEGYAHYAAWLRQRYSNNYESHAWPHDGAHRDPVTALPLKQAGEAAGITPIRIIPRTPDVDRDITVVKALLPRCYFDETHCRQGLEALAFYHTKYDDERRTFTGKPEHDWSSHAADAFRTLAVSLTDPAKRPPTPQAYADPGRAFWEARAERYRPQQAYGVRA